MCPKYNKVNTTYNCFSHKGSHWVGWAVSWGKQDS
jgi:hypothetical protein